MGHYTQMVCFKVVRLLLDCPVYCPVLLYHCAGRQEWNNNKAITIFITQNSNLNEVVLGLTDMVTLQHICSQMSEKVGYSHSEYSPPQCVSIANSQSLCKIYVTCKTCNACLNLGEMVGKVCDLEGDS